MFYSQNRVFNHFIIPLKIYVCVCNTAKDSSKYDRYGDMCQYSNQFCCDNCHRDLLDLFLDHTVHILV